MTVVELYQDSSGVFHYEFRESGIPRTRMTACGRDSRQLRHAAFFEINDERGRLHYEKACEQCRDGLEF